MDKEKKTSFSAAHQFHQFTFSFCLQAFLWINLLFPVAAGYQVENIFGLSYTGVHALCLYTGFGILAVTAFVVYRALWKGRSRQDQSKVAEKALGWALFATVVACLLRLLCYIDAANNGMFIFLALAQILIAICLGVVMTLHLLHAKHILRDAYSILDTVGALMLGVTIATVLMHSFFKNEDKFFNRVRRAQWQLLLVNISLAIVSLIFVFYFFSRHYSKEGYPDQGEMSQPALDQNQDEAEESSRSGLPSPCATLMQAQPFGLLLGVFCLVYIKTRQAPLMFWMTQNQTEVILAGFIIGALFGSQILGFILASKSSSSGHRISQVVCILAYWLVTIIILNTLQLSSFILEAVLFFFLGLTLTPLLSLQLLELGKSEHTGQVTMLGLFFAGFYAALFSWLADVTFYMNRDDPTWIYADYSIAALLVTISAMLTRKSIHEGCRCCMVCSCCTSRSGCCRGCCQERESD